MFKNTDWICPNEEDYNGISPIYRRSFKLDKKVKDAYIYITAMGVYDIKINDKSITDYVLAPGWTFYPVNHQYQKYDITDYLEAENIIDVIVATGWYGGRITANKANPLSDTYAIIAKIDIEFDDGTKTEIKTDNKWLVSKSKVLSCDIYDGIEYDATKEYTFTKAAVISYATKNALKLQYGEYIKEQEIFKPQDIVVTPKGEVIVDFGQNLSGYVQFSLKAKKGDIIEISHAEVLDNDGNFYNENYRSAKAKIRYICCDGEQSFKPNLTYFGFRYIRLDEFPVEPSKDMFNAIAVYSDMKRTGHIKSSNQMLNKLYNNIIWGQKSNFIDVPTDCPQRDEKLGWTGDAQVFMKCASYNFDVNIFFKKWLKDLKVLQTNSGAVPVTIPYVWRDSLHTSAGWGDVVTICPWQLYLMYGDVNILKEYFDCMKKWVDYISVSTSEKYLWIGGTHFGDWLGLDGKEGSYKGSSRDDFIASAFYAYSTSIVIKAGKAIGENIEMYQELYDNIIKRFREVFTSFDTQTECALAIHFNLANDILYVGELLANMIKENGYKLTTGFIGTPYLLHALSETGHSDIAYELLLQEEYPSWLYSVKHGATTIWEHWDGINDSGKFWSSDMNSYNHYAYGAVADWLYSVAGGILPDENNPGFKKVIIRPIPNKKIDALEVSLVTAYGNIVVKWEYVDSILKYKISTPVEAKIIINDKVYEVPNGNYEYTEE